MAMRGAARSWETDTPMVRAMLVTPAAALRSAGATTAIV